jgi:hypothetical protein
LGRSGQADRPRRRFNTEIKLSLTRVLQQLAGPPEQNTQLSLGMGRAHMRHDPPPPTYSAICTAVAPDAVRTRRIHAPPSVGHQLVPRPHTKRDHHPRSAP